MVYGQLEKNSSKKNKAVAAAQHSFKKYFTRGKFTLLAGTFTAIIGEFRSAGSAIIKNFSIEDLLVYKQLLSSFLDEAVGQMYVVKRKLVGCHLDAVNYINEWSY